MKTEFDPYDDDLGFAETSDFEHLLDDDDEDLDESVRNTRMMRLIRKAKLEQAEGRARRLAALKRRKQHPGRASLNPNVQSVLGRVDDDILRTKTAVRGLNLEQKVQADETAVKLQGQQRRIGGAEGAIVVGRVLDELKNQFPELASNPIVRYLIPFAPFALMNPGKRWNGIGSVVTDARFIGGAVIGGAMLYNALKKARTSLAIYPAASSVGVGTTVQLSAVVTDEGKFLNPQPAITWTSLTPHASVDAKGLVTGLQEGQGFIMATVQGAKTSQTIPLTINIGAGPVKKIRVADTAITNFKAWLDELAKGRQVAGANIENGINDADVDHLRPLAKLIDTVLAKGEGRKLRRAAKKAAEAVL